MALQVGELFASLKLNDKSFNQGMDRSKSRFSAMGGSMVGMAAGFAASMGVAFSAALITKTGVGYNALMEQSQVAWSTITGDANEAAKTIKMLEELGAATPFEFEGLDKAAKKLTMAGLGGKDLEKTLIRVGDAVSATGGGTAELEGVSTALFQMASKGKVSAEEMNQMAERGIPVWQMMADSMGKSVPELMKLSEQGKLMAKDALPALIDGFERFDGSMEAQSKTFNGMVSTMKDGLKILSGELMKPLFGMLKKIMPNVNEVIDSLVTKLRAGGIKDILVGMFPPEIAAAATKIFKTISSVASAFYESFMSVFYDTGEVRDLLGAIGISPEVADQVESIFQKVIGAFKGVGPAISAFVDFAKEQFGRFMGLFSGDNNILSSFFSIFLTMRSIVEPILTDLIAFVKEKFGMIKQFWDENGTQFIEAVKNVWEIIANIFKFVAPVIMFVVKVLFDAIKLIINGALNVIMGLIKIFTGLFTGDFGKMWEGVKQLFIGAIQLIIGWFSLTFIGGIRALLGNLVKFAVKFIKGMWDDILRIFTNMGTGVGNMVRSTVSNVIGFFTNLLTNAYRIFGTLRTFGASVWGAIKSVIVNAAKNIFTGARTNFNNLLSSITRIFGSVKSKITTIWDEVMKFFKGIDLKQIGVDIITGLIKGMASMATEVWKKAKNIAGGIGDAIKKKLEIKSPSKITTELGRFTGVGLKNGLVSSTRGIEKIAASVASNVSKGLSGVTIPEIAPTIGNIKAPVSIPRNDGMASINYDRLAEAIARGGGEQKQTTVLIDIDGKKFAKAVAKPMNEELESIKTDDNRSWGVV